MDNKAIGDLFASLIKKKNISQKLLCDGLCSEITISRIVTGKHRPDKANFEALMQRLGEDADYYYPIIFGARDLKISKMMSAIDNAFSMRKKDEAKRLMAEAEESRMFQKGLNLQYMLNCKVALVIEESKDYDELLSMSLEAIRITIPRFEISRISEYPLTYQEILAINMMGITYAYMERLEEAVEIFYALKKSMDNSYSNEKEKARSYTTVMYNLSKYLGLLGRHDEVLEICRIAKRLCIKYANMASLAYISYNEAYCLHKKGDQSKCVELFHQVYHTFCLMEMYELAEYAKRYAKTHFDLDIT